MLNVRTDTCLGTDSTIARSLLKNQRISFTNVSWLLLDTRKDAAKKEKRQKKNHILACWHKDSRAIDVGEVASKGAPQFRRYGRGLILFCSQKDSRTIDVGDVARKGATQFGRYGREVILSCSHKDSRTIDVGDVARKGATQFGRYGRELVSKTGECVQEKLGGGGNTHV